MEQSRKYQITIADRHTVEGESESSTITVFGTMEYQSGKYTLEYDEQNEGFLGSHIRMEVVEPSQINIFRTGLQSMEMAIEKGVRHACQYSTPYGSMLMNFYGTEVQSDMSVFGGTLSFKYTIDANGELVSSNELHISVKEIF